MQQALQLQFQAGGLCQNLHALLLGLQGGAVHVVGSGGQLDDSGMLVSASKGSSFLSNMARGDGGALHVSKAQLQLSRIKLSGNQADSTDRRSPATGGGIFCQECRVSITDSEVIDNAAASGGGAALPKSSTVIVRNVTFSGNRAATPRQTADYAVTTQLQRNDVPQMSSGPLLGGGGLFLQANNCSLERLAFVNNTAQVAGECHCSSPHKARLEGVSLQQC